jgi:predicted phage terminase large subunit-like protein
MIPLCLPRALPGMAIPYRPFVTRLMLVMAVLLGMAAIATGTPLDGRAAAAGSKRQVELGILFSDDHALGLAMAARRAELRLIDFVELMWPILDPGQPFVRTWVQEAICAHLEAITAGKITKLLINVPPGFTKSRIVNVMWPAWEWGPRNRPDLRYMAWSYDARLSEDQNNDCRKVIEHEIYQRFWGDRFEIDQSSNAKSYYKNDKGGWRRSSSVGGAGTGYRADRLIFDDPHNVRDEDSEAALREATRWFARTLPTRVRNLGGSHRVRVPYWVREVHGLGLDPDPDDSRPVVASATIGVMQRVSLHDISGVILKNPALGYTILLIEMRYQGDQHPARKDNMIPPNPIGWKDPRTEIGELADPIRYPAEEVDRIEAQMMIEGGSDAVAAQHQQWPYETSGTWFKVEWLPVIEPGDVPKDVPHGKRGWDFGGGSLKTKADPTACARLSRGAVDRKFYIWDTAIKRGSPGDVEAFIRQQHKDDPRAVDWSIPEDPGTGKLYADYVVREMATGRYVHASREEKDKVTRAKPVSAQAQHSNVVIVRHPGWERARAELVDFPYGDHDDIVDAISRAFAALVATPAPPPPGPGGFVIGDSAN